MVHGISLWRAYAFAWITLGLFLFSLAGHWLFGWFAYADEQTAHGQPIEVGGYTIQMLRDTLENWQSEFLQLLWQVGGLALFLHLGSPQSREGDERKEAKLDALLRQLGPDGENSSESSIRNIRGADVDRVPAATLPDVHRRAAGVAAIFATR